MIELFSDTFPGSALSGWTPNNPAYQTITVSGNSVHIVGNSDDDRNGLTIQRTGYYKSTLRQFTKSVRFKINSLSSFGLLVGADTVRGTGQDECVYAALRFDGTFQILFAGPSDTFTVGTSTTSGVPSVNTSDTYEMYLTVNADQVTAQIVNITSGGSRTINYTYNFSVSYTYPMVINIRRYSFGVIGHSDVTFYKSWLTTTQKVGCRFAVIGDSLSVGLYAGSAGAGIWEILKTYLSHGDELQIFAGGGDTIQDGIDNLPEVLSFNPDIIFVCLGTNDGGSAGIFTPYQTLINAITSAGKIAVPLTIPTGGNKATSGTFNNLLVSTYSNAIDVIWNGTTMDGLHPNAAGSITDAANIRTDPNGAIYFGLSTKQLFGGVPEVVVSAADAEFASVGINSTTTNKVFQAGSPVKSYVPGSGFNSLTVFEGGKGYWIEPKTNFTITGIVQG